MVRFKKAAAQGRNPQLMSALGRSQQAGTLISIVSIVSIVSAGNC
jgi:hypothetical protein